MTPLSLGWLTLVSKTIKKEQHKALCNKLNQEASQGLVAFD